MEARRQVVEDACEHSLGVQSMRCACNTGGEPRFINVINAQQLRCDDPTTQEQPELLKLCAFYHSIVRPYDRHDYDCMSTYMKRNGYVITRTFGSGWDKDFAHPTLPWTLPLCKTDEFHNEYQEWITLQDVMEEIFFETEQPIKLEYLIGSLTGLNWENVLRLARDTVRCYFHTHRQNMTTSGRRAWWLRLEARGLPVAVCPESNIDLTTVKAPNNPLGNEVH